MYQHFDPVGPFVGKEVGVVGVRCAEDLDHPGQSGVGAGAHVQWLYGQPGRVNMDQSQLPEQLLQPAGARRSAIKRPIHRDCASASLNLHPYVWHWSRCVHYCCKTWRYNTVKRDRQK